MNLFQVLNRPLITEKMTYLQEMGKYAFEVHPQANKIQVKQAVEVAFKVKVQSVRMITTPGERRRLRYGWVKTSPWKKAIVTLEPGYKIQLFEGV